MAARVSAGAISSFLRAPVAAGPSRAAVVAASVAVAVPSRGDWVRAVLPRCDEPVNDRLLAKRWNEVQKLDSTDLAVRIARRIPRLRQPPVAAARTESEAGLWGHWETHSQDLQFGHQVDPLGDAFVDFAVDFAVRDGTVVWDWGSHDLKLAVQVFMKCWQAGKTPTAAIGCDVSFDALAKGLAVVDELGLGHKIGAIETSVSNFEEIMKRPHRDQRRLVCFKNLLAVLPRPLLNGLVTSVSASIASRDGDTVVLNVPTMEGQFFQAWDLSVSSRACPDGVLLKESIHLGGREVGVRFRHTEVGEAVARSFFDEAALVQALEANGLTRVRSQIVTEYPKGVTEPNSIVALRASRL